MSLVVGTPASHAVGLMRSRLRRSLVFGALAVLAGGGAYLFRTESDVVSRTAMLCALIAAVTAAVRSRLEYVSFLKARAGVRTERRVAKVLERLGAAAVVHGALLSDRSGDADHLVLGPCAVLVESKTGRGRVSYKNNIMRVGNRRLPRDPVRQALKQRDLAAKRLGVEVDPVVCIVDAQGPPQQLRGVWVCSLDDLDTVVASLPHRLSTDRATAAAARLNR